MSTMTKERAAQIAAGGGFNFDEIAVLARIALASLEAEAVCVIDQSNLDYLKSGSDADVWPASRTEMGDVLLYRAAPPAPISVPVALNRLRSIVADPRALPRRKEWISGQQYSYVLLENVEAMVDDACRAAMPQELQKSAGVSNNCRSNENVQGLQAGNSPGIPDGWKLVPVEPTANQWAAGMQAFDSGVDKVTRVYKAMLAAAPQQEVK